MQPAPESRKTLAVQQHQLTSGNRRVQMFPRGHAELRVPDGMKRLKVPKGDVFHFDPKRIKASEIIKASKAGRENELLDLGPVSKTDAMSRVANGEKPVAVVERAPDGTEARAAAGTHMTAPAQIDAMNQAKSPGHSVSIEHPGDTVARRGFAEGGSVDGFNPDEFAAFKSSATPSDTFDPDEFKSFAPATQSAPQSSVLSKAIEPITSYPATYSQMNQEARDQMSRGAQQLSSPDGALDVAKGIGNLGLGAVGYVSSPINAALRTVVGNPLEEASGLPKEYTEFAAGMALPGVGLTKIGKAAEASVPTVDALYNAAEAAYKSPEVAALKLHPKAIPFFSQETSAALQKEGFDPLLAPKTFGLLEKAASVPDGEAFGTAQNAQTLRRMLGKTAATPDSTERAAAVIAQRKLDDFMSSLPASAVLEGDASAASKALQDARGNYAAASRAEQFDNAIDKASKQAARAGVGGNWENATRQQISSVLNSPSKSRGLSDVEKTALEDYVRGNFTRNALRVATKVLGGDNPLMAAIHAGFAFPTYGASLAAPATGYALKRLNNAISQKEIDGISELLRSRSPLAKDMEGALSTWAKTGGDLSQNPTTQNATRFFASAQLLGAKLKGAGANPGLPELMAPFTGLQSPGIGNAENGQQDIPGPPAQQKDGSKVEDKNGFAHGGAVKKLPHMAVGYRDVSRLRGKHCSVCSMFTQDGHCTLVRDPILPVGICRRFKAKD